MAIETTITLSGTATQADRTARIEIVCPHGQDYVIGFQREIITSQDGSIIKRVPGKRIVKKLSAVAAQTVTLGGTTLTVAQIAGFVAKFCDDTAQAEV